MTSSDSPRSTGLARVAPTATRQLGLFTLAQARSVGISRGVVDRKVRGGELIIVDERVYRSALTPPSWRQRLLAACLAGPAVASHRSAGALWRLPDLPTDVVEVTALRHRRRKAEDVIWHESYLLHDEYVTEVDSVPVTTPTRTFVDLAGVVEDDGILLRALDDMLRRRLTDVTRVARTLERLGSSRPGAARAHAVLRRRTTGPHHRQPTVPESDLETAFEALLARAGLPMPVRQHPVRTPAGRVLRLDFAYPRLRLGIELLGAQFHATPERWAADVERFADLSAIGWQVLLFASAQIHGRPDRVVAAVEHALARASADPR